MATLAGFFDRFPFARTAVQALAVSRDTTGLLIRPIATEDIYHFVKRIDNTHVVRDTDPRAGRACWKVIGAGVASTVLLMVLMLPSVFSLLAGYQIQTLRNERQKLQAAIATAELQETRLLSPEALDKVAKERNYVAPAPDKMVYLDGNKDGSRLARNLSQAAELPQR